MLISFLILTAILPQISESIFSPCLPCLSQSFSESIAACEHVFTTYLIGYSFGMLCWGTLSDYWGRVRTLKMGLLVYLLGVVLCYIAPSLHYLLLARCIQGMGGSACSVLVMAMCRDYFEKEERAGMLAKMGMAMSAGPMLGPVLGAIVLYSSAWYNIYVILTIYALFILSMTENLPPIKALKIKPESRHYLEIVTSRSIWLYALIIGSSCGIGFSFFSEAPYFYKIVLGLSDAQFSVCFVLIGLSWYFGGQLSYRLLKYYSIERVMFIGSLFSFISSMVFMWVVKTILPSALLIFTSLACVFFIMLGLGLVIGNAITLGLDPFDHCSGVAASVLGFLYYMVIALVAAGMAEFHDDTLMALPFYWFNILTVSLMFVCSIQPEGFWVFKSKLEA